MLLLDTRDGSTRQVPFAPAAAGLAVLVIDTRVPVDALDAVTAAVAAAFAARGWAPPQSRTAEPSSAAARV